MQHPALHTEISLQARLRWCWACRPRFMAIRRDGRVCGLYVSRPIAEWRGGWEEWRRAV